MKNNLPLNGEPLVILLVEDNASHAELIVRSFEDHRVANKIYHVQDGQEALDYLFRQGAYADPEKSPRPTLVLLDLRLPKVDGVEVLKQIRETSETAKIPVVILTSSESEKDVAKAYESYVNSYLVKPVDFEKFSQMMNEIGFYWLGWNHYPWSKEDA